MPVFLLKLLIAQRNFIAIWKVILEPLQLQPCGSLWIHRTCTLCDSGRYWSPLRKPTRILESTQNEHTQCAIVTGHRKPGPSWFNYYAKVLPKIKLK